MIQRWRHNIEVRDDDTDYADTLNTLSDGSVRRSFNPYTDIDWDSPEFAVTENDPRWILPASDPLGRHPWYQAQPEERKIKIGMWRQANVDKVGTNFESILIRGLMNYTFWLPNGSPEYRYCLHESVEECNHTLMLQEMVNRVGADVPGMPRMLRWISPLLPLVAGPLPVAFFIGVLASEEPLDHTQKDVLREGKSLHPIMERVMAIHVAEEARHIALRPRVPAQAVTAVGSDATILDLAVLPADHAGSVPGDRDAAQGVLGGVRHPTRGQKRALFRFAGFAEMVARHVRRHADAGL